MATDAQGRQLSDDGHYYWDGSAWQLVDQDAAAGADASSAQQPTNVDAEGRQLSDDGNYYWDGSAWQLVDASGAGQGEGQGQADASQFAQAMTQAGYSIDAAAVPGLETLQAGLSQALQMYQGLDPTTQAVIDAVTAEPGEASIGLAQFGVGGIDELLQAFDQIQGSLGELLEAAQQALQSVQRSA